MVFIFQFKFFFSVFVDDKRLGSRLFDAFRAYSVIINNNKHINCYLNLKPYHYIEYLNTFLCNLKLCPQIYITVNLKKSYSTL